MLQLRPTFSESWYRVKDLKPKLRAGAQVSRQFYRGDRWYVVRDPAGNQFHRLNDAAYMFVGLLDGTRTVGEAWDLVGGQLEDDAPTQPEVIQILSQLYAANLVETDIPPDATVLLRRHKVQQQRMMQGRLMNVLFPRIPLWDPDRFLCRWLPVVGLALTKWGALVWLLVVGAAIAVLAPDFRILQEDFNRALQVSQDPRQWLLFLTVFWVIKFIHECGHAFMCRRFGGEVHEMGIMFLVFVPTPYVDASTAWAFPNRWARMAVGAGGMIFELFVAALCAFVWKVTTPGVPVWGIDLHGMMSYVIFIASITTVIFNANPLLRYDGYYMLSDFLEIPNLQMKSREYLLGLIKRHVWRLKMTQPLPPPWQRVQLLVYGLLSTAYRIFVGVAIILMVLFHIPVLGILMALGGAITWLIVPVFKLFRYLTIEPELHRKRGRAWLTVGAIGALAFVLLGLINFPVNVYAEGVADPQHRAVLHAQTPGFVTQIVAKPGQRLNAGDVILIATDDELALRLRQAQAERERVQLAIRQAGAVDEAQRRIQLTRLEAMNQQVTELQRQLDALTVKSPIDGYLIAPRLTEMQGKFLEKGEEVATVATIDKLEVHAVIDQRDAQLAAERQDLNEVAPQVRLIGRPEVVLYAQDVRLTGVHKKVHDDALTLAGGGELQPDPRDPQGLTPQNPQMELRCTLANESTMFQPGQRAFLKLRLGERPLAWQWTRRFLQLIQTRRAEQSQLVGSPM